MRILSVYIGDTNITFDNCMWTGKEFIFVNGRLVSSDHSLFGMDHRFEVEEEGEWVEYIVTTGLGWLGISTDVRRNGEYIVKAAGAGAVYDIPIPKTVLYYESELV